MSADSHSSQVQYSPGERLRIAREQQGLSVQETAERLHVIPRYVRAIENAEFSQLPGLVFLKGYVRSYCRLVGLPENSLIADLEHELLTTDDPILHQEATTAEPFVFQEITPKKFPGKIIFVLVAAIVAIAALAGYQFFVHDQPAETKALTSGDEAAQASEPAQGAQAQALPKQEEDEKNLQYSRDPVTGEIKLEVSLSEPADTSLLPSRPEAAAAEAIPDKQNAADSGVTVAADQGLQATQNANARIDPGNQSQVPALVADSAPQSSVAGAVTQTGTDSVSLVATFNGDCWFDVRDRNNERIVGLYRAGDRVNFTGQYPLQFIVGAVNAVTITVNNQLLDFDDYLVKNNRAQFTLDQ